MLCATLEFKPETRASSGAEAVFTSTPDRVHAILDHRIERARQLGLADVVLVLADADRLRIDLHQLGQRILQAARDRHRAAQRDVQVRQFLRGEFGRRIHRGAGFGHHDLGQLQFRAQLDQVLRQLVGLARGGAVADRDQRHLVLLRQLRQRVQRAVPVVARLVRIDRRGIDHLAGGVDHRDLHAGAQAGIEPHGRARAGRRGQQQVLQVAREDVDRLDLGAVRAARASVRFPGA